MIPLWCKSFPLPTQHSTESFDHVISDYHSRRARLANGSCIDAKSQPQNVHQFEFKGEGCEKKNHKTS